MGLEGTTGGPTNPSRDQANDDGLTLEEYLATLSDLDKELLEGVPLTVDELLDLDLDDQELSNPKTGNVLTDEQRAKRAEIISKILNLRILAAVKRNGEQHHWYGYDYGNGKEKRDQQLHKKSDDSDRQRGHEYNEILELSGNVYYQINVKPPKFIIAQNENKQLVEASLNIGKKEVNGREISVQYLIYNKTYLTCIPTKIVRHKNPVTFLDQAPKYTMSFVDTIGEKPTFSHQTLSEIMSGLRDLGYVFGDGAEGALGTMVQAFKENKLIEDNQDMDIIGFFIIDKKIIASNIEIKTKEVVTTCLEDALKFIEELVPYYKDRLDLLSTVIVWFLVAPAIYMLKTNNYFLKLLHFYGFPNSTKSNSGKIGLAIDGHQDDPDFILNISRIDTIARLGDVVSHTTFPKLVDEADLNGIDKVWLINCLKSAIEGKVARSKFMSNRSSKSSPIPALSPLVFTSNSPPPLHDSGYMRRVIDRNFPRSESHTEDDPFAIKFREFLRTDLGRLRYLGEFRSWFIMNNQEIFLDETKRPQPLDLGLKILTAAYHMVGREMPKWFSTRLPECQLEESIGDNSVVIKRAFETYIDVNFKNALSYWQRTEAPEDKALPLPKETSLRLVKLMDSNLLPDIKRSRSGDIIIRKGILMELYKCGVTRDQLPNLRSLADYMNGSFRKSDGNKIVSCTGAQLADYFDTIEVIEEE